MFNYVIKNKDTVFKNFVSTLILFAILFIEGCFNFLEFEFNVELIKSIDFWFSILMRCTLLILIKVLAMHIFFEIARAKNKTLNLVKNKNDRLMKLKDADFPEYIDTVKNPEIAIEAWKLKINKKLTKLEKFSRRKNRLLYYKSKTDTSIDISKNLYCKKRIDLEYMLSKEYLEQNKYCLNVKCLRIDAAAFNVPVTIKNTDAKYQVLAKTKTAIVSSLFLASSWAFIMQIIKEASSFNWSDGVPLAVILGLILDLVFLLWQFFTGIMDTFRIIDEQEVFPYANRNRILEEYFYYKNPDKKDKIEQLLLKLDDEQIS